MRRYHFRSEPSPARGGDGDAAAGGGGLLSGASYGIDWGELNRSCAERIRNLATTAGAGRQKKVPETGIHIGVRGAHVLPVKMVRHKGFDHAPPVTEGFIEVNAAEDFPVWHVAEYVRGENLNSGKGQAVLNGGFHGTHIPNGGFHDIHIPHSGFHAAHGTGQALGAGMQGRGCCRRDSMVDTVGAGESCDKGPVIDLNPVKPGKVVEHQGGGPVAAHVKVPHRFKVKVRDNVRVDHPEM